MQNAKSTNESPCVRLCYSAVLHLLFCLFAFRHRSFGIRGLTRRRKLRQKSRRSSRNSLERNAVRRGHPHQSRRRHDARSSNDQPAAAAAHHASENRPAESSRPRSADRRLRNRLGQRRPGSSIRTAAHGRRPATVRRRPVRRGLRLLRPVTQRVSKHPRPRKCDLRLSATQRDRTLSSQAARSRAGPLALALSAKPIVCRIAERLEAVAGEIIQRYLREGNYAAARHVLDMWQTKFNGVAPQAATGWQQRFETAAGKQLAEASRLVSQKQYVPARKAVSRASRFGRSSKQPRPS